ncbi:hypothetical protein GLOTRDRAFT_126049 [Gloeophyllum trabeum ATCC 11539]|uniref:Uncharacterized protein n=1 Tax=Gloeophyllum trabeum (strain ATCC 11539 / FP-39264 / Madison 617) TaxID=670483 RepID=S7QJB1_GLOTA|nr:uncharacterized protein GLOTRDRAFT_126049 [Gloeophyllum trabeum ATCC 11539]EPQ59751.1 hypothetical protein GLOTRDRAFT_126049 [Gloeophyllum trabeum ATCC 11539]
MELVIYMIEEQGLWDATVVVYLDNQGVIGSFDRGQSCNWEANLSKTIRRTLSHAESWARRSFGSSLPLRSQWSYNPYLSHVLV